MEFFSASDEWKFELLFGLEEYLDVIFAVS